MKKYLLLLPVFLLLLTGCSNPQDKTIAVGGSTSVQPLMEDMITDYMSENLDLNITYDGQGSSAGITGVVDGKYQIGTSSRDLKDEEIDSGLTADTLCLDGIVVVVNADNPVQDLTLEQVRQIYTGEITSWSELGGPDQEISVIARDGNSGTREAFEENVGFAGEMTQNALELSSNGEVLATVQSNPAAIGYASLGEIDPSTENIALAKIDGVEPTPEAIIAGDYTIARPFLMVYDQEQVNPNTQNLIDWINQNKEHYAQEFGYIPVPEETNEN